MKKLLKVNVMLKKKKRGLLSVVKLVVIGVVGMSLSVSFANSGSNFNEGGLLKFIPEPLLDKMYPGAETNASMGDYEFNNPDFNIIHSHNFNSNTLGNYNNTEKRANWGNVGSFVYDNRPGHPRIVDFDGGRRAMNEYLVNSKGDFTTSGNGSDFAGSLPGINDEVYHTYRVYFQPGFDFYYNGKLPGFRMWPSIPAGQGLNPRDYGSIIYLTWGSKGELLWNVYHHQNTRAYGDRMGKPSGFFTMQTGQWYDITFRVVLNTPGVANGILQIWVNGDLKDTVTGVLLRTKTSVQNINQQVVITFMDWDVPVRKTQYMYMDDFFVWKYSDTYLKNNPNVARGIKAHPQDYKLYNPLSEQPTTAPPASFKISTNANPPEGGVVKIKTGN